MEWYGMLLIGIIVGIIIGVIIDKDDVYHIIAKNRKGTQQIKDLTIENKKRKLFNLKRKKDEK